MKTAKEIVRNYENNVVDKGYLISKEILHQDIIEFGRMCAEKALNSAANKATIKENYYKNNQQLTNSITAKEFHKDEYVYFVDKYSILDSFNLEDIK